jgi:hypothetical protein
MNQLQYLKEKIFNIKKLLKEKTVFFLVIFIFIILIIIFYSSLKSSLSLISFNWLKSNNWNGLSGIITFIGTVATFWLFYKQKKMWKKEFEERRLERFEKFAHKVRCDYIPKIKSNEFHDLYCFDIFYLKELYRLKVYYARNNPSYIKDTMEKDILEICYQDIMFFFADLNRGFEAIDRKCKKTFDNVAIDAIDAVNIYQYKKSIEKLYLLRNEIFKICITKSDLKKLCQIDTIECLNEIIQSKEKKADIASVVFPDVFFYKKIIEERNERGSFFQRIQTSLNKILVIKDEQSLHDYMISYQDSRNFFSYRKAKNAIDKNEHNQEMENFTLKTHCLQNRMFLFLKIELLKLIFEKYKKFYDERIKST